MTKPRSSQDYRNEKLGTAQPPGTAIAGIPVIEVFPPDAYHDLGDGDWTLTAGLFAEGLNRGNGTDTTPPTPSQPDDVLSMQPDGTWQTRPAGTAGNYERCKRTAAGAVYRPIGADGKTWLVGVAAETPNS